MLKLLCYRCNKAPQCPMPYTYGSRAERGCHQSWSMKTRRTRRRMQYRCSSAQGLHGIKQVLAGTVSGSHDAASVRHIWKTAGMRRNCSCRSASGSGSQAFRAHSPAAQEGWHGVVLSVVHLVRVRASWCLPDVISIGSHHEGMEPATAFDSSTRFPPRSTTMHAPQGT